MEKINIRFISSKYSIYVVYGEEDLLRIEYIDNFRRQALSSDYLNKYVFIVDSINFNWDEIDFVKNEQGLFSKKKLIEINIPNGQIGVKGSKFILNLVKSKIGDTIILFIFPRLDKLQLQSKWFQAISSVAKIIEAKKINIDKLPFWIKDRLSSYNLTIDNDALDLFIDKVEGNLLAARQEIDKLYLNLDNKRSNITFEDIDKKVSYNSKYDIFQLSIAWMKGDIKRIIALINNFKLCLQEPILILWLISEDIRTLLKLKKELALGNSIVNVKNKLRLWGEKQKFALIACHRLSDQVLLNVLQECAQIDKVLKGVNNNTQDVWIMFKQVLISLSEKMI